MVGKVVLDTSIAVYKKLFPAPPPAPTVKFGKLPFIKFPEKDSVNFTYTLETPTGEFPKLPDQLKIYFVAKSSANLLSLDLANQKAKGLGFNNNPQQVSDTIYRYQNPNFPSVLEMNIVSGVFSISYDLNADKTPLENKPTVAQISISNAKNFLTGAGLLPSDLTGEASYQYLKLTDGKFVKALSQSEADAIKINLFRKSFDGMPSLTASEDESNVWFIMSGSQDKGQQMLAAEYHYYPVDETQYSTYPIKTPEAAFNDLKSGKGFISNVGMFTNGQNVRIRNISLAYYDPEGYSEFYQPIYVFEGGDGTNPKTDFTAYVPAVSDEYYGKEGFTSSQE